MTTRPALFVLGVLHDSEVQWIISVGKSQEVPDSDDLIQEGEDIGGIHLVLDASSVRPVAISGRETASVGPAMPWAKCRSRMRSALYESCRDRNLEGAIGPRS